MKAQWVGRTYYSVSDDGARILREIGSVSRAYRVDQGWFAKDGKGAKRFPTEQMARDYIEALPAGEGSKQ